MDYQLVINILLALVSFFGGWFVKSLKDQINDIRSDHNSTKTRLQNVELLVAGQYVTRTEFEAKVNALFMKLDKIQDGVTACRTSGISPVSQKRFAENS